ncbi:hypothetical protein TIFTF001_006799 [Ficus carica]|uniref:BURP domain-containing protein n=1 Tax=Ficus carica TaxID=3494 RepID=A0AA87ZI39_FICCA|nr:hypothetical protein TIFTF001_006799 [Ficus carica]
MNQPYMTSYGDVKDTSRPYETSYGGTKETNEPYITGYRADRKTNQPYITGYRNPKETSQPYVTAYGDTKETNQPYVTSYGGTKETNHAYITGYRNAKETSQPYVTAYGDTKEINQPYVTSYGGTKETNEPYITGYRADRKTNQPYITGYRNARKTSQPYVTAYGDAKETNQPYVTSYGGAKENNQHPYITGYVNAKADQGTYITGYNNAKGEKEHPYMTGYISDKEKNLPYISAYGDSKEETKCKKHLHAGHNHMMGHENHMPTQPSTGMDHTEAFKVGFFTPEDLYAGKIMPLYFPIKEHSSRFLPREVAESIPFSTSQLPNLLQLFSIPQGSPEAKEMEQTLGDCELKPIDGEIKLCATSLESMVEFVRSMIGSRVNFNLLSTTHPTMATELTQNYTVSEAPKEVIAPKMVFCHPEPYPYAVFFCHFFGTETKVFQVALRGESGDDVEAMAVCHMDTSDWDPNHVLFSLLGVKPGASSPVCHFLPKNHLVWIPSPATATA